MKGLAQWFDTFIFFLILHLFKLLCKIQMINQIGYSENGILYNQVRNTASHCQYHEKNLRKTCM